MRNLQRGEQLPADLPAEIRTAIDDALGKSYKIPDEQLAANLHDPKHAGIRETYDSALRRLTEEAAERDVTLARHGLGDPDRWAMRVTKDADGGFQPMSPDQALRLGISPSSAQAKTIKKLGQQVKAARSRVARIAERADRGRWAERGGVFDSYRALKRQATQIGRQLDDARVPRELAGEMLDDLNRIVDDLGQQIRDAGFNLDDVVAGKYETLQHAANLGAKGEATAAARSLDHAGRAFEARLAKEQGRAQARQAELDSAVRAFDRVEEKFAQVEAEMRASLEAAPAVARPILQVGRAMGELDKTLREGGLGHLADDLDLTGIPRLLEDFEAAGVSPTFLRRMEERLGATGQRAAAEQPVKTPTMRAQRRREMTDVEVRRDIDRVKVETDVELANRVLAGQMAETFQKKFGRSMDQIAESLIEGNVLNREAWRDMAKHQREKLLQEQGYNVYAPEQIFSFKVRRTGADDVWVPRFLNEALVEYQKAGPIERMLTEVVGPATTTWKHFVLALRPAWQVYNAVGNFSMSTLAGGVPVRAYLEFMKPGSEAHRLMRHHRLGWDLERYGGLTEPLARELMESGISGDLRPNQRMRARLSDALIEPESVKRFLDRPGASRAGRAKQRFDRVVGTSYRVNAYMDNLSRSAVYLHDTLKKGMSPEDAIRHANRTLGEYTRMTPAEKVYLRSAFPFYAWMRHITRLSSDMLRPDNITRAAVLGSVVETLGDPAGTPAEFYPEYMGGDITIPGTDVAIGMRGFNPWQDVLDVGLYNQRLGVRGALRSAHPLAQLGMERMTGIDTLTGRPFSRPSPVLDDLGREVPTAPGLPRHLWNKVAPPQAQLGENLLRKATGQTTSRYSTGEPVLVEGGREPSMAAGVGGFFGLPLRFPDVEGIEERRGNAMDRVARQMERYRQETEEYEQRRARRSLPERLTPFGR